VLFLSMVITVIGLAFYGVAGYEIRQAQYQRDYAQAFWSAETGLDRAVVYLSRQMQPPREVRSPYTGEVVGNGTYDIVITPDPANETSVEKLFLIRATGRSGRAARVIEEKVRMEGFSRYGYFTNEELNPAGSPIWFVTGDDVGGKTHTNGIFHIAGSPQFRGPVSSASSYMVANPSTHVHDISGWPAGSNNPTFHEGLTLGIPPIDLPNDTGDLREAAQRGGLDLVGDYQIEFGRSGAGAGSVSYRPSSGGSWVDVSVSSLSSGVIHVTGNASLSGTLDGEVTLGVSRTLDIVDDVLYADAHPSTGRPNPGCNDILGIVAGENVIVKDLPTTRGNLVLDATVMALNTSFKAENHNSGTPRGTLHIWGGLIQERRGQVGYSVQGTLVNGYSKDYNYDQRVSIQPPPEFPLTGIYTRVSWTEKGLAS